MPPCLEIRSRAGSHDYASEMATQPRAHDDRLDGTPYLVGDGQTATDRFSVVADRARTTGIRARKAAAGIAHQARGLLPQFELSVRSDLVAESNRMEGIDTSPRELRELV